MASLSVSEVTAAMIAAYRDQRLSIVKPATVRRELAVLRHCFEVARKEWGFSGIKNPFVDVKLPTAGNARDRRLSQAEWSHLYSAVARSKAWYLRPMIELAIETGMRRGELLGLLWANVDLQKRIVTLPITKNGKPRKVPLTKRAASILRGLPRRDERVLPVTSTAFRQAWARLMNWSRLGNLTFHDLRHEAISRFFEMGLSVPEVALISGHRDYKMLFRYTHIRPEPERQLHQEDAA
jgi:integrase